MPFGAGAISIICLFIVVDDGNGDDGDADDYRDGINLCYKLPMCLLGKEQFCYCVTLIKFNKGQQNMTARTKTQNIAPMT